MKGSPGTALLAAGLLGIVGCKAPAATCPPSTSFEPPAASAEPPLGAVDVDVDPCVDFHAHACGPWERRTTLAPSRSMTSPAGESADAIELELRALLDGPEGENDPAIRHARMAYARCMETPADALAGLVLPAELRAVLDGVKDRPTFLHAAAVMLRNGVPTLFEARLQPDLAELGTGALYLEERGIGLPEPRMLGTRDVQLFAATQLYRDRIAVGLRLRGAPPELSADVLALEQRLAEERASRTAPYERWRVDGVTQDDGLRMLADVFAEQLGIEDPSRMYLGALPYATALAEIIDGTAPETLRAYLQWHLVHALARWQPEDPWSRDVEAVLDGRSEPPARWRRCVLKVHDVFDELGPAVGMRVHPPEHRAVALELATQVQRSLEGRVRTAAWAPATLREYAGEKIATVGLRMGPAAVEAVEDEFVPTEAWLLDALQLGARQFDRTRAQVGVPLDAQRWPLPAIRVSAYYGWAEHRVSVGLPRLRAPLFDPAADPARNLGTLGFTVGHEMGHAIGRVHILRDAQGRETGAWALPQVWEHSACVGEHYARLGAPIAAEDHGRYDEAIADRIGLLAAEATYLEGRGGPACFGDRDAGLRLLYTSFAQSMCGKTRAERRAGDAIDDEHSAEAIRINATVSGRVEFRRAFGCGREAPMSAGPVCDVW